MRELKARDSGVTVLVYKNLASMMSADERGDVSTGVTVEDAAEHPDWFLRGPAGERPPSSPFRGCSPPTSGARPTSGGGPTMSSRSCASTPGTASSPTTPIRRSGITSDPRGSRAIHGCLVRRGDRVRARRDRAADPRLRQAHHRQLRLGPAFGRWRRMARHVSGAMEEQFAKFGTDAGLGYVTGGDWERQLGAVEAAESRGRRFLASPTPPIPTPPRRATGGRRCCSRPGRQRVRPARRLRERTWVPEYDLEIGDTGRRRSRDPSACTAAASPTASCWSTRRRARSRPSSAGATAARTHGRARPS